MLGAIIGDIIGSRFEFNPTNDYDFELFSPECSFTDDTICTIAVTDALLHGSDDYGKFIHEWCRKYPNPMGGYGASFRNWVMSNEPEPYGSYGNGAAMRVSPIGWWFGRNSEIIEEAKKCAACSHNHPEGLKGAAAVALGVNECLCGGLDHAMDEYGGKEKIMALDIEQFRNRFDETCQGTVPVAFWIVLHSNSFEDAIRRAVSLGADADTLGAIVGGMAEGLWDIPKWVENKTMTYLPEEMKAVMREFWDRI